MSSTWRAALVAGAGLAAGVLAALPASAVKDDLGLISRSSAGAPADAASRAAAITPDGRFIAFQSAARNLGPDRNPIVDIFRHDVQTGRTILVSRPTGGFRVPSNGDSINPSISADGNRIAFTSKATNLSSADRDSFMHVYVRDVRGGTTTLVSRASGDGPAARSLARGASISADGNLIAFQSSADNLSNADGDGNTDIFVRDLRDRSTRLVSVPDLTIAGPSDGSSRAADISADGGRVAFLSTADNLAAGDGDGIDDVFVRVIGAGRTILASRAADGSASTADSGSPSLSDDGTRVVFHTTAPLDPGDVNATYDVYLHDLDDGTTALVSRAPASQGGAVGNAFSLSPAISGDGRHVGLISRATNLATFPAAPRAQLLTKDLQADAYVLASRAPGPSGAPAAGNVALPSLSRTGRFAAFQSGARNLLPASTGTVGIFRRDVLGAPGEGSGGPAPGTPPLGGTPAPAGTPLRCDGRPVTIVGTTAAETILGTPGPDVILALGGDDLVRGGAGDDRICLGRGADRGFGGAGRDRIFGQRGNDRIAGGAGRDRIDGGPGDDRLRGQAGNDALIGRGGRDRIDGGPGNDALIGNRGNDRLIGRAGRDLVRGGGGRDTALGGAGNDRLRGDAGRDRLLGQRGRDRLIGGSGFDRALGGPGRDRCSAEVTVSC